MYLHDVFKKIKTKLFILSKKNNFQDKKNKLERKFKVKQTHLFVKKLFHKNINFSFEHIISIKISFLIYPFIYFSKLLN